MREHDGGADVERHRSGEHHAKGRAHGSIVSDSRAQFKFPVRPKHREGVGIGAQFR
jgi:hypothetical protein